MQHESGSGVDMSYVAQTISERELSFLSEEQKRAAQLALSGEENILLNGAAGTGKSYVLNFLKEELLRRYDKYEVAITATTGIAVIHIDGQTLHSFAGIGLGKGSSAALVKKVMISAAAVQRWRGLRYLVLDEVSM